MDTFTRKNPTDDTKLQGSVLESPKKPRAVIAIVHGFGEHIGRYEAVAKLLGSNGFAVLGLDLHGHGRTTGKRGHVAEYERLREDVDALTDEARTRFRSVPVFLWGHSMGGGLVLDYVLRRGGRGLRGVIATGPLIEAVGGPSGPVMGLIRLIGKVAPGFSIANRISGEQISTMREEQARYEADTLNHDRLGVGLALGMLGVCNTLPGKGAAFPLPLLLMHARDDQLTRCAASEKFAQSVPDCNFHAFEGVEHEIHNDTSRGRVVDLITQFIEDHRELSQNRHRS